MSPTPPPPRRTLAMGRSPSAGSAAASMPPCATLIKSHPCEVELIDSYLRTWVETGVKKGAFIHDADVYAADPAAFTRQLAPALAGGERVWYFYTQLRHKSVRGKRKTRTVAVGGGCWHNEAKSKPVYMFGDGGKYQIGRRQSFSFVNKDTGVKVRTGWLMVELSLLKDGADPEEEEEEEAFASQVLCKVYRSPRKPEVAVAASPVHKAEADDDESSDATFYDDDDSSDETLDDNSFNASLEAASGPKTKPDRVESSAATVAARNRHSKANEEISGGLYAAPPGRKGKAEVGEGSAETSAAAPPPKRKALDDESSGAAAPARKKRADGSSSSGAIVPATEMQCPQCGTHFLLTLKRAESKPETDIIAKDDSGETRGSSQKKKKVRFLEFL